jgi:anti-sigma regulatory factor (Ser/Thr protein kinase)
MEAAARYDLALLVLVAAAIAVLAFRARRPGITEPAADPAPPSLVMQAALLPANPPIVDGLRVSWSCVPATAADRAGGDFHDAFFLDDGTLAVAIGEAAGAGIKAVVAMNVVRQAIRSALIDGARPVDALRRANRVLLRSDQPGIVTALAGIIDPATLQFRYAAAGHPAPLLAAETCAALSGEGSGIALGVVPLHVTSEHVASIPENGVLALYTDGCLAPDDAGLPGTQALAEALTEARTLAPSRLAETIDQALFGRSERADDATILTIAAEPQIAHLDVRLPAEPASSALARTALRRFLASTPLSERRSFDAVVAAGEAVANAIEHAYDRRPNQSFVLRGRYEDHHCTIVVEDTGLWNDVAPPTTRGHGIAMMRELSDAFEITRTPGGSSVQLDFQIVENVADAALVAV